jgi:hypothetical protein
MPRWRCTCRVGSTRWSCAGRRWLAALGEMGYVVVGGDVAAHRGDTVSVVAEQVGCGGERRSVEVGEEEAGPTAGELSGTGESDAVRAGRDDGELVIEADRR